MHKIILVIKDNTLYECKVNILTENELRKWTCYQRTMIINANSLPLEISSVT